MKKILFFTLFLVGSVLFCSAQTNADNSNFVPASSIKSKKSPAPENTEPADNTNSISADPIIEGSHTIITMDRYGNRTETVVPPVTASQRRAELNTNIESLKSKLFTAQQEEPNNTTRIKEIEDLITKTEKELNELPQ